MSMTNALRRSSRVGLQGRLLHATRTSLVAVRSSSNHEATSSSGRELSCSGGPVGFGTLRKGFKPQPKRTQKLSSSSPTLNGRDKAEVLQETNADVESKLKETGDMWEDWKWVDAKVNKYPCEREFTAVGSGGDDFKAAMVKCVEDVVGGPALVNVRASSGGAYLSVRVGPVRVQDRDQVLEIFNKMRQDKRLKFHL